MWPNPVMPVIKPGLRKWPLPASSLLARFTKSGIVASKALDEETIASNAPGAPWHKPNVGRPAKLIPSSASAASRAVSSKFSSLMAPAAAERQSAIPGTPWHQLVCPSCSESPGSVQRPPDVSSASLLIAFARELPILAEGQMAKRRAIANRTPLQPCDAPRS